MLALALAGLFGWLALPLGHVVLWAVAALSLVAGVAALFLLYGYHSIRYELSARSLDIRWARRHESVDLAAINAVVPASEIWPRSPAGRRRFWSGYYVDRWDSPLGPVEVIATMPPRRQLLVSAGERRFAISPERPVLFLREYARLRETLGLEPDSGATWVSPSESMDRLARDGWTGSFPSVPETAAISSAVEPSHELPERSSSSRVQFLADPAALGLLGLSALLTFAMVAYVGARFDTLPSSIALHWNVNGYPDVIGSPRAIWTIPVITALVTLLNLVLAWSVAAFDRFAARLLLGGSVLVQFVAWIGLLTLMR